MPNAMYSYDDVKNGTGSYSYEANPIYSLGVETLQKRLQTIGYTLPTDGMFEKQTQTAVTNFQKECSLSQDGIAGKNTLVQLDKVYQSSYFSYGAPLSSTEWSLDTIRAGKINDIDLLARIIFGEENVILNGQSAVARVIYNRSINSSDDYYIKASDAPNASIWARVVAKTSQYSTAGATSTATPARGKASDATGINPAWKNAVDLATCLVKGTSFSNPAGYLIDISDIKNPKWTSSPCALTSHLNQQSYTNFKNNLAAGKVKTNVPVVCFESSLKGNVYYTYG